MILVRRKYRDLRIVGKMRAPCRMIGAQHGCATPSFWTRWCIDFQPCLDGLPLDGGRNRLGYKLKLRTDASCCPMR